jgi:tellurite resistance protein TehA-like permease
MRNALLVIGIIATLIGLVWIGQGTGYFPYPASSFMISQMPWAWRGIVLALIGLGLIWYSRRR